MSKRISFAESPKVKRFNIDETLEDNSSPPPLRLVSGTKMPKFESLEKDQTPSERQKLQDSPQAFSV
jgi:hypothetical protein